MRRIAFGLLLLTVALDAAPARAHPHVFVTATSELLYREDGAITGVRHAWTFDEMFSTYALQGLPHKTRGVYTREELAELAQTNVDSLKEYRYFTFAKAGDEQPSKKQFFADPIDYYVEYTNGALVLHFTLPFKTPVKAREVSVEIYDPSYFVDFSLADKDPIKLVNAPAGCAMRIQRPADGSATAMTLDESSFTSGANANYGMMFANKVRVSCP